MRFKMTALVLALGFLAAPLAVEAQPAGKVYRIGVLLTATREETLPLWKALDVGLRELGYIEGRNLAVERRFAEGRPERLPELASEFGPPQCRCHRGGEQRDDRRREAGDLDDPHRDGARE